MDSLITAAARALAAGDPLGALKRVSLREDAPALALRGIAMAQLADFARARMLLRKAAQSFGSKEAVSRARCIVAEAEVALASRDLAWPARALDAARVTLERHGDGVNAAHARYLEVRRLLLIGRLDEADRMLALLNPAALPASLRAAHELMRAGIGMRRLRTRDAREALALAEVAAREARIPALSAEVQSAIRMLGAPAARVVARGARAGADGNKRVIDEGNARSASNRSAADEQLLRLDQVEALFASKAFVVDACRNVVRQGATIIPLARRPVLFVLARALAESWPEEVTRDALCARAFRAKRADESHRARLRVEMGRLRRMLRAIADVQATKQGFALVPRRAREVVVLALPIEEENAAVLALLSDGESWSSSALALALGTSQRTVQRALDSLEESGKVQAFGKGRARRWMTPPLPGFTTTLLLPMALPLD